MTGSDPLQKSPKLPRRRDSVRSHAGVQLLEEGVWNCGQGVTPAAFQHNNLLPTRFRATLGSPGQGFGIVPNGAPRTAS